MEHNQATANQHTVHDSAQKAAGAHGEENAVGQTAQSKIEK